MTKIILDFITAHSFVEGFAANVAAALVVALVLGFLGWAVKRWSDRQAQNEDKPEVKLVFRKQTAGRFRFAEFLVANPFAQQLVVTEIRLRGFGSGERIAPALWSEGQEVAIPRFEIADGRTFSLRAPIRPSNEFRKWSTVKFFPWHHRLPNGGVMRLAINLRIKRPAPQRREWIYKFETVIPEVGKEASFDPVNVRAVWCPCG